MEPLGAGGAGRRRAARVCRLLARPDSDEHGRDARRRRSGRRQWVALLRHRRLPALDHMPELPRVRGCGLGHLAALRRQRRHRLHDDPEVRRHLRPRGEPDALQDERQRTRRRDHLRRRNSGVPDRLALDSARSATMRVHRRSLLLFAPMLLGGALGCAQLESDNPSTPAPAITIGGPNAVVVGQTVTLTAATSHGTDTSYTFTSANPTVATVDESGLVTGVTPGQTSVTVTGANTKATASTPIVVEADASQVP